MRLPWVFLCSVAAGAAACAVDPELTCGAPCADSSTVADGGSKDGTVGSDASDAATGNDVVTNDVTTNDSGCKGDGGYCQSNSSCCSGACNQNGKCSPSCSSQGSGCSQQTCCIGNYCNGSTCVQCKQDNSTCSQDYECCGGGCQGGSDGGSQHCSGN